MLNIKKNCLFFQEETNCLDYGIANIDDML